MTTDPGLTDNAIYMEAVSGDGGAHNASGTWWLSSDVLLNDPTTSPGPPPPPAPEDQAAPSPAQNDVDVRFHWKAATTLPGGTSNIIIELYAGNPAIAMTPVSGTKLIATKVVPTTGLHAGDSPVTNIKWTTSGNPSDPDGPGHKCLIARCYPDSETPDPGSFHLPDDPHVAQHNIAILPVPLGGERFGFRLVTANLNREKAETVTVRAVADLQPSKQLLRVLLPRLDRTSGFRQVAQAAPRSFTPHFNDFPQAKVQETTYALEEVAEEGQSRLPSPIKELEDRIEAEIQKRFPGLGEDERQALPAREAQIDLKPGQVTPITVTLDVSSSHAGDAHVMHFMQVGSDGRVQGGFTLVGVVV